MSQTLFRAALGVLLLAAFAGLASYRLGSAPTVTPVQVAARVPDALGSSLARSFAETSRGVLRRVNSPALTGCEAAINEADAAAYSAAELARGTTRNQQNISLVLAAEDAYLGALRHCVREARPFCQPAQPPVEGCDRVRAVNETDLGSIRMLRAAHGG